MALGVAIDLLKVQNASALNEASNIHVISVKIHVKLPLIRTVGGTSVFHGIGHAFVITEVGILSVPVVVSVDGILGDEDFNVFGLTFPTVPRSMTNVVPDA